MPSEISAAAGQARALEQTSALLPLSLMELANLSAESGDWKPSTITNEHLEGLVPQGWLPGAQVAALARLQQDDADLDPLP